MLLWWFWKSLCFTSHAPFHGLCCLPLRQFCVFMGKAWASSICSSSSTWGPRKGNHCPLLCQLLSFPVASTAALPGVFSGLLCRLGKPCTLSWYISATQRNVFSLHFLPQELDIGSFCDDHKETKSMSIETLCCLVFQLLVVTGYESSEFVCSFNFLVVSSFPNSGSTLQIWTSSLLSLMLCSDST